MKMFSEQVQVNQHDQIQLNTEKKFNQQSNNLSIISNNSQIKKTSYRADIDGLRAVAVSMVVIFHAWPQVVTGGFIGVDIFFVISGFLISSIIIKQISKGKFSYREFYSRRIKRIYPALITVLLFVLLLCCYNMAQLSLKIATKTIIASTLFGANIEILNYERGYFDPQVKTNPLLHLWSLGVEEQFYFIWPLFLGLILYKCSKKVTFKVMMLYSLASFVLNIYFVYRNPKFSFYFPLCRFWQMAVGGIIAYTKFTFRSNFTRSLVSIVSMLVMLLSAWYLNENSLFPGWWALIPTVGAALIISSGEQAYVNKYVLSSKMFVFVGKISYPLYLWHWPLLVFSRLVYMGETRSLFSKPGVMVLIAFLLSLLTQQYVEKSLRYSKSKWTAIGLLAVMISIGVFAAVIRNNPKYYSVIERQLALQNQKIQRQKIQLEKIINQKRQKQRIQEQQKRQKQRKEKQQQQRKKQQIEKQLEQQHQRQKQKQQIEKQQQQKEQNQRKQQFERKQKQKQQKQKLQKQQYQLNLNYIHSLEPGPLDYYQKNGKKLPNASKNRFRQSSTLEKVQYTQSKSLVQKYWNISKIPSNTSVYSRFPHSARQQKIQLINEGQNKKKLFIIGDSHAWQMSSRFLYLHEEAVKNNKTESFPMIVTLARFARPFFPCNDKYKVTMDLIDSEKPDRILISFRYIAYLDFFDSTSPLNVSNPIHNKNGQDCYKISNNMPIVYFIKTNQNKNDVIQVMNGFEKTLKTLVDKGIEVYVSNVHLQGTELDPKNMKNGYELKASIVPFIRWSKFKNKHKFIFDILQKAVKNSGAKMIDFSDHDCWQDVCYPFIPSGYGILSDDNHYTAYYNKYWASSADFLVDFDKK